MDNFSYNSYPESGNSSPRSREIEFEQPWEENLNNPNYKVKFMCSYGGKIHPRPHDNQLAYVGGETKILAVERSIKLNILLARLSSLCDNEHVCFKYQLPGEDLDALISVTTDDDLEHMMNEYDRLYRASAKPARLRLFLFPVSHSSPVTYSSSEGKSFVEALNSGSPPPVVAQHPPQPNNVDFLFGLDKGMAPPPVAVNAKPRDPIVVHEPETFVPSPEDRIIGSDQIQKHIQDLRRLRIGEEQARLRIGEEQAMYKRKSDDGFPGEYYVQKTPEKVAPTSLPPQTVPPPAGYWPEKQIAGGVYPASTLGLEQQQQVYMIPTQANMYGRPVTGPPGPGYYAVQRVAPEVYREQPIYNVQAPSQPTLTPPQALPKTTAYAAAAANSGGGVSVIDTGYAHVAYDSGGGRQVYYTAPPPTQYQAMAAAAYGGDMRGGGNHEGGKVVPGKVSQA